MAWRAASSLTYGGYSCQRRGLSVPPDRVALANARANSSREGVVTANRR